MQGASRKVAHPPLNARIVIRGGPPFNPMDVILDHQAEGAMQSITSKMAQCIEWRKSNATIPIEWRNSNATISRVYSCTFFRRGVLTAYTLLRSHVCIRVLVSDAACSLHIHMFADTCVFVYFFLTRRARCIYMFLLTCVSSCTFS